jgi:hypothetical protein
LYITVNVNDNLAVESWTNFLFFFNTGETGTTTNGWGRPIDFMGETIDYFLGSWVNDAEGGISFRNGRQMLRQLSSLETLTIGKCGALCSQVKIMVIGRLICLGLQWDKNTATLLSITARSIRG